MLFEHAQKRRLEDMEFQAAMHGAKLNNKSKSFEPETGKGKFEGCVVGDPETYKHLTKEERQEWTAQLLKKHKQEYGGGLR